MNIKFANTKTYNTAFGFLEGNGFCFRSRRMDRMVEFYYEHAVISACVFFDKLGLKYEIID